MPLPQKIGGRLRISGVIRPVLKEIDQRIKNGTRRIDIYNALKDDGSIVCTFKAFEHCLLRERKRAREKGYAEPDGVSQILPDKVLADTETPIKTDTVGDINRAAIESTDKETQEEAQVGFIEEKTHRVLNKCLSIARSGNQ